MGRLIPAGTGLAAYKRLSVDVEMPDTDELPAPPAVEAGALESVSE